MNISKTLKEVDKDNLIKLYHLFNDIRFYMSKSVLQGVMGKAYIINSQKSLNIIRKFCLGIIKQVKDNYNQSINIIRLILSVSFEKEIERIFSSL